MPGRFSEPRRLSVAALGGLALALLAGTLLLIAAFGYRSQTLELGTAFTALRWGAYVGAAAAIVSLLGLVLTVVRRQRVVGFTLALFGLVIGAICYSLPAQQQARVQEVPLIHDISTDTEDPPQFVAVLPLRAEAPNPPDYDPSVAPQQQGAYPDVTTIELDAPPDQAFEQALTTAEAMGWELVDAAAADGRIEATDTTFWFGFKDDVVIRIRPAPGGSIVDVRSKSRVGLSDVGANAQRIRAFRDELITR